MHHHSIKQHGQIIRRGFPLPNILLAVGAYHAMDWLGGETHTVIHHDTMIVHLPAAAAAICAVNILSASQWTFNHISERILLKLARTPTGVKGTGRWSTRKEALRLSQKYGWGSYFGMIHMGRFRRSRELIIPYESVAVTYGPSGSGKTTKMLLTNAFALKYESKFLTDFKADLTYQLYHPLSRYGEVIVLDISGEYADHPTIKTACYNPFSLVLDCFEQAGCIVDVKATVVEIINQLYPINDKVPDPYWPNGAREALQTIVIFVIILRGTEGHLGHVEAMLNDSAALLADMQFAAGSCMDAEGNLLPAMALEQTAWAMSGLHDAQDVANFIAWFRRRAGELVKMLSAPDTRQIDSFLSGARQQLSDYAETGRLFKTISKTTFRFWQMKEGNTPTTILMPMDSTQLVTQNRAAALLQKCMLMELQRHPNKPRLVFLLLDEAGNAKINGLDTLPTYSRSYGIRLHLFLQNIAAYEHTYGEHAAKILESEAEITQFLPGIREEKTIKLAQRLMGNRSIITTSTSGERNEFGVKGTSYREESMPLLDEEQIRRTRFTLLFVGQAYGILSDTPTIFEARPWAHEIDPNPHYGTKKKIDRAKLVMDERLPPLRVRCYWIIKRIIRLPFRIIRWCLTGGRA